MVGIAVVLAGVFLVMLRNSSIAPSTVAMQADDKRAQAATRTPATMSA
jgi:hypothetical protein